MVSRLSVFSCCVLAVLAFLSCRTAGQPAIRAAEDFPFDPQRKHQHNFSPTGALEQISDNLYLFRDCCNVYVVKNGNCALLVDFGSGKVMDRLAEIGVDRVERVLVTHHHRDQVQGLCDLENYPFLVTVPSKEAQFFENVEQFWKDVRIYINYDCRSHFNTLRKSVKVHEKTAGGEIIDWKGMQIKVIDTPGHTDNAVSYAAEIDGKRIVFCGDLISAPGKVTDWFDLHWAYYGFTQGMDASDKSFARIADSSPDLLAPSHGSPIQDPVRAMAENSRVYDSLQTMLVPNELHRTMPETRSILPHLLFLASTSYVITSQSGKAFVYDFGDVDPASVRDLKKNYGVTSIDGITFSHYHHDHNIGTINLFENDYPQVWIFEKMLDVFENPIRYSLPCLLPFPIYADRVLHDNEKVQWEEYTFEFFHMPGQTEFHQGMITVIDGKKVMFTGDNTWKKIDPLKVRNGPLVPRNEYFLDGGFIVCADKMLAYQPDIVCPGHTEEYSPTREDLEGFRSWALELREVMTGLIDQPDPNFGMDNRWCRFYPYRLVSRRENGDLELELMVRNHLFIPATLTVELKFSDRFQCEFPKREVLVEGKKQVAVPFVLKKVPGAPPGREIVTADVTINGCHLGEYAEALID